MGPFSGKTTDKIAKWSENSTCSCGKEHYEVYCMVKKSVPMPTGILFAIVT